MYAGMKSGKSVEEVTAPFAMLISCPWQRFVFKYLLDEEDADAKDDSEEATRTKEQTLAKAMKLLRAVFKVDESCLLLTEDRLSRLLGAILLNGQERRPTSPWLQYVAWLKENGSKKDYKAMKSLAKNNPTLQYSTRGQVCNTFCPLYNKTTHTAHHCTGSVPDMFLLQPLLPSEHSGMQHFLPLSLSLFAAPHANHSTASPPFCVR